MGDRDCGCTDWVVGIARGGPDEGDDASISPRSWRLVTRRVGLTVNFASRAPARAGSGVLLNLGDVVGEKAVCLLANRHGSFLGGRVYQAEGRAGAFVEPVLWSGTPSQDPSQCGLARSLIATKIALMPAIEWAGRSWAARSPYVSIR